MDSTMNQSGENDCGNRQLCIHVYVLCWNEAILLPHFFRHYSFAEKIVVFDNGSTDDSIRLIQTHPSAELRRFGVEGSFDDSEHLRVKNTAWKESRGQADFVVVCDLDEFLDHSNLPAVLALMKQVGGTVLKPVGYDMVSDHPPESNEDIPKLRTEAYAIGGTTNVCCLTRMRLTRFDTEPDRTFVDHRVTCDFSGAPV